MSGRITSRSTTTARSCLYFLSRTISSSRRRTSPSTFTRVKPSARRSSSIFPYSPLRPRTTGARTMKRVPSSSVEHLVDDLVGGLAGDRLAADVAVRVADARPQQAQVVVDLGDGADRRPRVARGRLLVDRDRRRQTLDRVDVGLVHLAEELAGVGGQRLDVAALALGVDRVERERGLPGSGQPGDHHQRVARQRDGDVPEVVLPRPGDDDLVGRRHSRTSLGTRTDVRSRAWAGSPQCAEIGRQARAVWRGRGPHKSAARRSSAAAPPRIHGQRAGSSLPPLDEAAAGGPMRTGPQLEICSGLRRS